MLSSERPSLDTVASKLGEDGDSGAYLITPQHSYSFAIDQIDPGPMRWTGGYVTCGWTVLTAQPCIELHLSAELDVRHPIRIT